MYDFGFQDEMLKAFQHFGRHFSYHFQDECLWGVVGGF
jgi:hypothetical protein